MIEHIETKQIVLYLPGLYDALWNHLSCVTCHVSGVTCHFLTFPKLWELETYNFHIIFTIPYVPSVTCQVSHIWCHMSVVTCHLSCIMCNVSYVMCHVLCVIHNICIFLQSGWVGWLRLRYQQGLPRLFFRFFCYLKRFDIQKLLFLACSGPFWVIKKSKLMRIKF